MSRTNEAKHIKWRETYKCQCRLDASVYNNKERCNHDKCKRQCKELIDNGRCNKYLFGILVIVNVTVISYVILESI